MSQTPASILILAASVLGYAAAMRYYHQSGVLIGLAGLVIGAWGVVSLVNACIREREMIIEGHAHFDAFQRSVGRDGAVQKRRLRRGHREYDIDLPSDLQAQLSAAARLEGRDRNELVVETLRRYLPPVHKSRTAA